MNVVIFGATGMIGQGALKACLADPSVTNVLAIGRAPTGRSHPKLRELVRGDLSTYAGAETEFEGYDACFFCLGVSSNGMDEASYTKITYDLTIAAATVLSKRNPGMTFVFVSGTGADSSEKGRIMWARVKGRTENALRRLPFKAVYIFRPGVIQPRHGIRSKTRVYQFFYSLAGPLLTALRQMIPQFVLTTENLGQAMIAVSRHGAPKVILESRDIYAVSLWAKSRD